MDLHEAETKDKTPNFDKSRNSQSSSIVLDFISIFGNEEPRELSPRFRSMVEPLSDKKD